jgi:hypothetical protein
MGKMRFNRLKQALVVPALLAALVSGGGYAEAAAEDTQSWVVVGSAPVPSGNLRAAREAAIADGLMEAVALTAAEILPHEKFVENFKTLSEQLLENPERFVQNFKVLSEAPVGKQHRVALQVAVAAKKLRAAISDAGLSESAPAEASAPVEMTVEGTANLPNFVKFRKALGALPGVDALQIIEMRTNESVLLVKYAGNQGRLSTALRQQAFDTFTLEVSEEGENALRVKLLPK